MGKGGNFVETMIRMAEEVKPIRVVDDQILTPTYTVHLARAIIALLQKEVSGIIHITNQGSCSWYQFAYEIFQQVDLHVNIEPIPTSQYPTPARRPVYSVLDNHRLKDLGMELLPPWQDALARYIKNRDITGGLKGI